MTYVNQLFIWIQELQIQSQDNLVDGVIEENVKNNPFNMLEYSSPLVQVSVPHIKLTNFPKIVENLKNMEVVNPKALKYSDFGHGSCCKEIIIFAKIEADLTKKYINFTSTENFVPILQSLQKEIIFLRSYSSI